MNSVIFFFLVRLLVVLLLSSWQKFLVMTIPHLFVVLCWWQLALVAHPFEENVHCELDTKLHQFRPTIFVVLKDNSQFMKHGCPINVHVDTYFHHFYWLKTLLVASVWKCEVQQHVHLVLVLVGCWFFVLWISARVSPLPSSMMANHRSHSSAHTQPQHCFSSLLAQSTVLSKRIPYIKSVEFMCISSIIFSERIQQLWLLGHAYVSGYTVAYKQWSLPIAGTFWSSWRCLDQKKSVF